MLSTKIIKIGPLGPDLPLGASKALCILALCSKTRDGPYRPLDITFLEFFLHFYNFWVKMVEKNFGLVRISKNLAFKTP